MVIRDDQRLGRGQGATKVGQQVAEMAAGCRLGRIGPEEKAEVLAGERLEACCQTIEQRADLATRDGEGRDGRLYLRGAQQVDS